MFAKRQFLSTMAGLAMLALPMTAVAADHHHNWKQTSAAWAGAERNQPVNFQPGPGVAGNASRFGLARHADHWNDYRHRDSNWKRGANWEWQPPITGYHPLPPRPAYGYVSPPREYAYAPPAAPDCGIAPANYGDGGYLNGYGDGNDYASGNRLTLRDRLLRERAGAYQQLAIRERNGDRNGAHHLRNAIESLNRQLASLR